MEFYFNLKIQIYGNNTAADVNKLRQTTGAE